MENTQELDDFLNTFPIPAKFEGIWDKFRSLHLGLDSEARFDRLPRTVPSHVIANTYEFRIEVFNRAGTENQGFRLTVDSLRNFQRQIGWFAIRTKTHHALFFLNEEDMEIVGFLYFGIKPQPDS